MELNEFKSKEMHVHLASRRNTQLYVRLARIEDFLGKRLVSIRTEFSDLVLKKNPKKAL